MKLALERPRHIGDAASVLKESKPFVVNDRAVLIHRPRSISLYNLHKYPHLGIRQWCGNTHTGMKKFTFIDAIPEGRLVCAICEVRATMAGLPSADEICGRHVHKGRMFAKIDCCQALAKLEEQ